MAATKNAVFCNLSRHFVEKNPFKSVSVTAAFLFENRKSKPQLLILHAQW